MIVDLFNV